MAYSLDMRHVVLGYVSGPVLAVLSSLGGNMVFSTVASFATYIVHIVEPFYSFVYSNEDVKFAFRMYQLEHVLQI